MGPRDRRRRCLFGQSLLDLLLGLGGENGVHLLDYFGHAGVEVAAETLIALAVVFGTRLAVVGLVGKIFRNFVEGEGHLAQGVDLQGGYLVDDFGNPAVVKATEDGAGHEEIGGEVAAYVLDVLLEVSFAGHIVYVLCCPPDGCPRGDFS